MTTFAFFLVVGLILLMGVLASVRLYVPGTLGTGRFRRIRRLRTVRAVPGMVSALPAETVIEEEIIDEKEPEPEGEEV